MKRFVVVAAIAALLALCVAIVPEGSHEHVETGTALTVAAETAVDAQDAWAELMVHYEAEAQEAEGRVLKLPHDSVAVDSQDLECQHVTGYHADSSTRHVLKHPSVAAFDGKDNTEATRHEVAVLSVGVRA